jgi:hypothetical protein
LLSEPSLFRDAIDWQVKLDAGIDPSTNDVDAVDGASSVGVDDFPDGRGGFGNDATTMEMRRGDEDVDDEEEEDSTFRGLRDDDDGDVEARAKGVDGEDDGAIEQRRATSNETFAFDPFGKDDDDDDDDDDGLPSSSIVATSGGGRGKMKGNTKKGTWEKLRVPPPLPHLIFAPDAEVVLPQAMTATQLFGIERETGIELEAASGMISICTLFGRWLAIMPEGDHDNVMDPPGLTTMKISGGGYRVTAAHRVVWR